MRPAELLALAAQTAPTAPARGRADAGDADAFARALDAGTAAASTARTDPSAGDGHCGVAPTSTTETSTAETDSGEDTTTDAGTPRRPDRPARPTVDKPLLGQRDPATAEARAEWRDFLQSLRDMGLLPGHGPEGKPTDASLTARGSETSTPKTATDPAEAATPFGQALDALGAAIQAALADPAANPAQPGQLPPAVQTALDAAIAVAPGPMQERLRAFADRLTERLAAAMAGTDGAGTTETAAAPATGARSPIAAALAAALQSGDGSALALLDDLKDKGGLGQALKDDARASRAAPAETAAPQNKAAPDARIAPAADPEPSPGRVADPAPAAQASNVDTAAARAELATTADRTLADATARPAAQAPAAAPAQPADARAAATLAAARGAPELVAQMAAVISRKLEGRVTRFNMELNPAEMGRVDVKLSIEADGRIAAQMSFDNPAAAADMRGKADELRRQLEQSGFSVASEDLTFTDRDGGQSFADARDQSASRDNARGRAFREADRTARLAEDAGRLSNRAVLGLDMRV